MASGTPHCLRRPVPQVLASQNICDTGWIMLESHYPRHTHNINFSWLLSDFRWKYHMWQVKVCENNHCIIGGLGMALTSAGCAGAPNQRFGRENVTRPLTSCHFFRESGWFNSDDAIQGYSTYFNSIQHNFNIYYINLFPFSGSILGKGRNDQKSSEDVTLSPPAGWTASSGAAVFQSIETNNTTITRKKPQQALKLAMTNNQNLNPVAVDAELGVPLSFCTALPPKASCCHIFSLLRSLSGSKYSHRSAQKNSQLRSH